MRHRPNRFGAGQSRGLVIVAEILVSVGAFAIYIVVLPMFIPRFTQVLLVVWFAEQFVRISTSF